jgi:hypothetical protein
MYVYLSFEKLIVRNKLFMKPSKIIENREALLGEEINVEGFFVADYEYSYILSSSDLCTLDLQEALLIIEHEKIMKKCRGRVSPFIGGQFLYVYKIVARGVICVAKESESTVGLKNITYLELIDINESQDFNVIYKIDMDGRNKLKTIERKMSIIIGLEVGWNESFLLKYLQENKFINNDFLFYNSNNPSKKYISTNIDKVKIILDSEKPGIIEIEENLQIEGWSIELSNFVKNLFINIEELNCNMIAIQFIDILKPVDDYKYAGSDWINTHVLPNMIANNINVGNTKSISVEIKDFLGIKLLKGLVFSISTKPEDIESYSDNAIKISGGIPARITSTNKYQDRASMLNDLWDEIDEWQHLFELYEREVRQPIIVPLITEEM